jgi:predicted anti-sigma-YlaC factor YlaD
MRCDRARDALSARLDHEDPGTTPDELDAHLARCGPCRAHAEELTTLHRQVRVREAEPVPDLTAAIMAAVPNPTPRHRSHRVARIEAISGTRWALLAVALTQLALAAPGVLLGEASSVTSAHAARELGAFEVALAVGLLVAAWQPARAYGLLPLAVALGAVLLGTAVVDIAAGGTALLSESPHLLEIVGVLLLWRVAKDPAAAAGPRPLQVLPA